MNNTPDQVRIALGILALHGAPVTEQEYRKLTQQAGCTVSAGYLMMQGYVKHTIAEVRQRDAWIKEYMRHYELTERGLEALK